VDGLAVDGATGAGVAGVLLTGFEAVEDAAGWAGAQAVAIRATLTRRSNAVQVERRTDRCWVKLFKSLMLFFLSEFLTHYFVMHPNLFV